MSSHISICFLFSLLIISYNSNHSVRLESGEVGTELWNTLGGGKTQESGNAEGAGKRKCGRRGKAEMRKARESGNAEGAEMRKAECDRIMGRWMNGRGVTEEGRTEGRKDGRKEGRTDGRKEGRTEGRKDGWMERLGGTDRRKDGRTEEGWTDRRKDGRNILCRCERLGLSLCAVPSLNGTVCVFLFGRVGVTERA